MTDAERVHATGEPEPEAMPCPLGCGVQVAAARFRGVVREMQPPECDYPGPPHVCPKARPETVWEQEQRYEARRTAAITRAGEAALDARSRALWRGMRDPAQPLDDLVPEAPARERAALPVRGPAAAPARSGGPPAVPTPPPPSRPGPGPGPGPQRDNTLDLDLDLEL